ncbi:hypothetical protein L7F22_028363 [Adiantum nelumboides]|nr:hypothetical protein [Adiantum nelumboides]
MRLVRSYHHWGNPNREIISMLASLDSSICKLANKLSPASGAIGFTSRDHYAKRHKLPTAEELLALEVQAQGSVRTCLDVLCTEPDGGEFCQTGCLNWLNLRQSGVAFGAGEWAELKGSNGLKRQQPVWADLGLILESRCKDIKALCLLQMHARY